jgi:UDP-N-acetylmuramyl pentapeptide phosphotransferase/UDP-N-acetylglucosamine-1-phosphate transferase
VSAWAILLTTVAVTGLVVSSILVGRVRRWAVARGVLDSPNPRSSHTVPIPRGGGWAIVVPTLALLLAWPLIDRAAPPRVPLGLAAGSALIALVSWRDDLRSVGTSTRLLAHTLAVFAAVAALGYWRVVRLPFGGEADLGLAGLLLTFIWIVGLTNAFNFMDGIDGLAGGQAALAGAAWGIIGGIVGQPLVAALGVMIAAASVGFLRLNWPPARIFMGDVGSTFLGYTCAVLPLLATAPAAARPSGLPPWTGLLLVWPFVFDSLFTFLRRLRSGENVFAAHRSHLYQRLITSGLSHRSVTTLYLVLGGTGALAAVLRASRHPAAPVALAGVPPLAAWLWWYVSRRERQERVRSLVAPSVD